MMAVLSTNKDLSPRDATTATSIKIKNLGSVWNKLLFVEQKMMFLDNRMIVEWACPINNDFQLRIETAIREARVKCKKVQLKYFKKHHHPERWSRQSKEVIEKKVMNTLQRFQVAKWASVHQNRPLWKRTINKSQLGNFSQKETINRSKGQSPKFQF